MGLRFILGRAGSGKTHACLSELRSALVAGGGAGPAGAAASGEAPGPALILLVPEQATFQVECELVGAAGHRQPLSPGAGSARAQALSFRRLAWRVLAETGGAARPRIDDLGKRMVLRSLLLRRRGDLRLFAAAARRVGFIDRLVGTLTELHAFNLTPEDLDQRRQELEAEGRGDAALACKLHDLALVWRDLDDYLTTRFTDPDDYLSLCAAHLPESELVRGARVWVDGFSGFTPQEYGVLEALLPLAAQVNVALCLDPDQRGTPDESDLFHPTRETFLALCRVAHRAGVRIERPLRLRGTPRFAAAPALGRVERLLFPLTAPLPAQPAPPEPPAPSARPAPAAGEAPAPPSRPPVEVVAAATRRAEVAAAVHEVLRLCRDEGYRWRDIAIIVREMEPYHDLLLSICGDFGVPCFIDRRRPVPHHPLVELVRSALEVVTGDFAYEPAFRYLKTDLVGLDRDAVDALENYVLRHGIRGRSQWLGAAPWRYMRQFTLGGDEGVPAEREVVEAGLGAINAARAAATQALARLCARIDAAVKPALEPAPAAAPTAAPDATATTAAAPAGALVSDLTNALWGLLDDLGAAPRVDAWRGEAEAGGDPEGAREHVQVWNAVVDLLDQVVDALGDQRVTLAEYLAILEAGLEGIRLGLIPPGLDQVVVGSVERSRHPAVRAALVLGVGDGAFPAVAVEDAVFTDREREELAGRGTELGPTSRLRLFHEQYLAYIALTRPGERLRVSYPLADEKGRALAPSPLVRRLRQVLPATRERFVDAAGEGLGLEVAADERSAAAALALRLRRARAGIPPAAAWAEVYRYLAADPPRCDRARSVLAAVAAENRALPLEAALVRGLMGEPLRTSVSRLERFAACPFAHFLADGLLLRERELYRVTAPELGVFYHACLRRFVERLFERGRDWASLATAESEALLDEVVAELAPRLQNEILLSSARYRYLTRAARRTLGRAIAALGEHARRGRFKPVAVEVGFGRGAALPPLLVEVAPGVAAELRGWIDRIDAADYQGRCLVRVIDYKSRPQALRLEDVYHGLSLQLPAYLAVALENAALLFGRPAEPAGLLYFPVRDPLLRRPAQPLDLEAARRQSLRQLRAGGLVLNDPAIIKLMEEGIEQWSDLLPVALRGGGALHAKSQAVDPEKMKLLMRYARRRAGIAAARIAAGQVDLAPFRRGQRTPCGPCPYRPVCRFDPLAGDRYRSLPTGEDPDTLWQRMAGIMTAGGPTLVVPGGAATATARGEATGAAGGPTAASGGPAAAAGGPTATAGGPAGPVRATGATTGTQQATSGPQATGGLPVAGEGGERA